MIDQPPIAVIFKGAEPLRIRKPTVFDWVKYYAYNLARKPKVIAKKRELESLSREIKYSLEAEVLTELQARMQICIECRNAYMALKPQIFLSQIKMILSRMQCPEHPEPFTSFLRRYESKFALSEDIASWINGFKK